MAIWCPFPCEIRLGPFQNFTFHMGGGFLKAVKWNIKNSQLTLLQKTWRSEEFALCLTVKAAALVTRVLVRKQMEGITVSGWPWVQAQRLPGFPSLVRVMVASTFSGIHPEGFPYATPCKDPPCGEGFPETGSLLDDFQHNLSFSSFFLAPPVFGLFLNPSLGILQGTVMNKDVAEKKLYSSSALQNQQFPNTQWRISWITSGNPPAVSSKLKTVFRGKEKELPGPRGVIRVTRTKSWRGLGSHLCVQKRNWRPREVKWTAPVKHINSRRSVVLTQCSQKGSEWWWGQ